MTDALITEPHPWPIEGADLRRALADGELRLEYLPIVELGAGRALGVEALLRWDRRPGESLGPGAFLEIAERSGELVAIGRWVLATGLREVAAASERAGVALRLSVNLSLVELLDPSLPDVVASALEASGHPAESLCLEVSERSMVGVLDEVADAMMKLKQIGVRMAIDDFGIGVSSLSQLQRLPVDEVKIDRSFVARMHEDSTSAAIARSVVYLARSLHLATMAEGVEFEAQEKMLLGLRCTSAQGWLYSTPQRGVDQAVAAVDSVAVRRRTQDSAAALWSGLGDRDVDDAARLVESAFEHAPIGIAIVDGTGTQLAVNPALCLLLGAPAAELVGTSCWDAVDAEFVPEDQARMDAVLRGEIDSYALVERYVDAAGRSHWVEVTVGGAPEDAGGAPGQVRLLRQVRSIEDRRKAEERQALLAAVVDATADAIVVVDREGAVTHWNPAAEHLLGWPAGEVIGRHLEEVVPPRQEGATELLLADVLGGQSVRLAHTTLAVRDGSSVPCDMTMSAVTGEDGPTAVVAVARDMREQVAAAQALEEAHDALLAKATELTDANGRLRAFAHRVSHDLQQPLTALGGFLHLLDAHRAAELGEEAHDWVLTAMRAQRRLVEAVDALLRTAVGAPLVMVEVDLGRLVDDALAVLDGPLAEVGGTVDRRSLPTVVGDEGLLSRAFANLLANACRYRDDSRPLRITVDHRPAAAGQVTIVVEDNGRGFAAGELESVFEEGQRGTASSGRPGTGTGLAIVRAVVGDIGGRVWAEHVSGGGARVCLELRKA